MRNALNQILEHALDADIACWKKMCSMPEVQKMVLTMLLRLMLPAHANLDHQRYTLTSVILKSTPRPVKNCMYLVLDRVSEVRVASTPSRPTILMRPSLAPICMTIPM